MVSRRNDSKPWKRSPTGTPAHAMPATANTASSTGRPPGADSTSRRNASTSASAATRAATARPGFRSPRSTTAAMRRLRPRARRRCAAAHRVGTRRSPWSRLRASSPGLAGEHARRRGFARAMTARAALRRCRPAMMSASWRSLASRPERSASRCHRCRTPVANRPSLRRTPARIRRMKISESSRPQPLKAASKPSTASRSSRQNAILLPLAPRQRRARCLRRRRAAGRATERGG